MHVACECCARISTYKVKVLTFAHSERSKNIPKIMQKLLQQKKNRANVEKKGVPHSFKSFLWEYNEHIYAYKDDYFASF